LILIKGVITIQILKENNLDLALLRGLNDKSKQNLSNNSPNHPEANLTSSKEVNCTDLLHEEDIEETFYFNITLLLKNRSI